MLDYFSLGLLFFVGTTLFYGVIVVLSWQPQHMNSTTPLFAHQVIDTPPR